MIKLLTNHASSYHVSLDTVEEFEHIILSDPLVKLSDRPNKLFYKSSFYAWKALEKMYINQENYRHLNQSKSTEGIRHLLAVLMGPKFNQCLPHFFFSANKSIYIFDAWPQNHESIIRFAKFFGVDNVFVTSSQSSELLQDKLKGTKCYWIPEGIDPGPYKQYAFKNKNIDVIAIGRRYDAYHEQIVGFLEDGNKTYLYEKKKGEIIFPTRNGFIDGMARSKISICVPSSTTHPDRSGDIETMTIRYLQSMISKCIVVGHAPKEMTSLFGYNPVVEIDQKNPVAQMKMILANYSDYFSLVEKNYNMVMQNHTWVNRWRQIKEILINQ